MHETIGRRRSGHWCGPGPVRETNNGPGPEGYQATERSDFLIEERRKTTTKHLVAQALGLRPNSCSRRLRCARQRPKHRFALARQAAAVRHSETHSTIFAAVFPFACEENHQPLGWNQRLDQQVLGSAGRAAISRESGNQSSGAFMHCR